MRSLPGRVPGSWAAAAAGITLLIAAGLRFVGPHEASPDGELVAVAPIENRTGDTAFDALAHQATDRILRDVADVVQSAGAMGVLRTARVVRASGDPSAAGGSGDAPGAGTVVFGEIYLEGGSLRFHVRVVDAVRGGRLWPIPPLSAPPTAPERAVAELGRRASGAVVALRHPALAEWFPVAAAPPTYDALAEYIRGLEAVKPWESGERMERAARIDTTFVWALLESAWQGRMLDRAHAHAIVVELSSKRERMNTLQGAALSSLLAREAGDRRAHHLAMATAARLAPSRFLMEYAMSASDLHMPELTLALLDRADRQLAPRGLPPSWQTRTDLLHQLERHGEELALARRARARMPHDLSALSAEARALAALGQVPEVDAVVDSALLLPAETFYSPGTLMMGAAEELRAHGHTGAADGMTLRAVDWYSGTPATFTKSNPAWHEYYLANALYQAGELDRARRLFEKLAGSDPGGRAEYYGMLGAIAARRKHPSEAEAYLDAISSLRIPTEAQPDELGRARARIAARLGDATRALAFLREGYDGGQGVDLHTDVDFQALVAQDADLREFVRPKG